MKIAYITAQAPWGKGETFILEEMLEIKRQKINFLIIPRNPPKEVFHKKAKELLENSVWLPLISFNMIFSFLKALFAKLSFWKILGTLLIHPRNPWIFIKNLAVFPKGVFIAGIIKKENIDYIHAHWGSTTATMAYIVSRLTNIPWSFTLHRWDIKENNMLKEKVKSANFVRIISEHGKNELLGIIGEEYKEKIKVIHVGVKIPEKVSVPHNVKELFTIAVPANLIELKGHKHLIEACSILVKRGIRNFKCIFYGEGKLRTKLENFIKEKKLTEYIKIVKVIPHEKLMEMYKNKEIDLVVLPSITTKEGGHEGIPVSLMEAMAYGVPVISTNTGGIPELLSNGAGIIVEEKSPEKLSEALMKVVREESFTKELSQSAYRKIQAKFNIGKNTKTLLGLIQQSL